MGSRRSDVHITPLPRARPVVGRSAAATRALRGHLAAVPDAAEFAYGLTQRELYALKGSRPGREGWVVEPAFAYDLFLGGLSDRAGYLTAFGYAVRRKAMREDA